MVAYAQIACKAAGAFPADAPLTHLVDDDDARAVLASKTCVVASTGNLGLAVGLTARALGMKAQVHVSRDAIGWKVAKLVAAGCEVIEHAGSYSDAVAAAREVAAGMGPAAHSVDDERSVDLMLGYSAGAAELVAQLKECGVEPTVKAPLVVHIPCGVGGVPAGILWGLHLLLGDAVKVTRPDSAAPCVGVQAAAWCLGVVWTRAALNTQR